MNARSSNPRIHRPRGEGGLRHVSTVLKPLLSDVFRALADHDAHLSAVALARGGRGFLHIRTGPPAPRPQARAAPRTKVGA